MVLIENGLGWFSSVGFVKFVLVWYWLDLIGLVLSKYVWSVLFRLSQTRKKMKKVHVFTEVAQH